MYFRIMKFPAKYAGKWVASRGNKIIASEKTLTKLVKKVKEQKDVRFALIPNSYIAGFFS